MPTASVNRQTVADQLGYKSWWQTVTNDNDSILSVSEAARVAQVSRTHIYKLLKSGKLSSVWDSLGKRAIDRSELARLFPYVQGKVADGDNRELVAELRKQVQLLENQVRELKDDKQALQLDKDRLYLLLEGQGRKEKVRKSLFDRLFMP